MPLNKRRPSGTCAIPVSRIVLEPAPVTSAPSNVTEPAVVGKRDFDRQFRQVFDDLGTVLKGMGIGFDDVVEFTTYLVHSQDIETFMRARAALFPKIFSRPLYPPNTLLIVDRLVKEDFLIEV